MEYREHDRKPEMRTYVTGDGEDKIVLSVPEASIRDHSPEQQREIVAALDRLSLAIDDGDSETYIDDLAIVLRMLRRYDNYFWRIG